MPIGDNITQPIPPVGNAGTGYASQIVAFLTEVKARLEAKVALTSLLAGLFDLSNNAIANAKYLGLYEQSSSPITPVGSVQKYNGDLYYVSPSGAVRITNGATLNVTAAHGITGDYGNGAEEMKYVLADTEYYAYSDQTASPKKWAYLGLRALDIYGTLTSTTRVRLGWVGGSSYGLTLPAALPGTTQILQVDNAGNITFSNTVVEALTLAANKDVVISGTARYKHGTLQRSSQLHTNYNLSGPSPAIGTTTAGAFSFARLSASCTIFFQLPPLDKNKRLTSLVLPTVEYESGTGNITYDLMYWNNSTGVLASTLSAPLVTNAVTNVTLTPTGSGYGVTGTEGLWLKVTVPAATTIALFTAQQNYDGQ